MVRFEEQLILLKEKDFAPRLFWSGGKVYRHTDEIFGRGSIHDDVPVIFGIAHRVDDFRCGSIFPVHRKLVCISESSLNHGRPDRCDAFEQIEIAGADFHQVNASRQRAG